MTPENPDSDSESDSTAAQATVRLRVERAAIPTLGELEGVKVVFETSGGRLLRLAALLALALALASLGLLPMPW